MKQAYKLALEIILNKVTTDGYVSLAEVKMICETALKVKESQE